MARIAFGPFLPDLHPLAVGGDGLVRAVNAVPYGGHYRGFRAWQDLDLSGDDELDARVRGAIGGLRSGGAPFHFAGDVNKLYELGATGFADVSRAGAPAYSLGAQDLWRFAQFKDTIVACPGISAKAQGFLMGTHTDFTALDDPAATGAGGFLGSGTAPTGRYPVVIGRQLFIAHLAADPTAAQWGVIDNPNAWPTPGGALATAGLSGLLPLQGGGTKIQAAVSSGEVGGFLKDQSLWRADFAGGDVQWAIRQVVPDVGCLIAGLAIPFGHEVLFYSEHGWKLWSYGPDVVHVGDGVVDSFFKTDWNATYPERVSFAIDQLGGSYAVILYVGQGAVGGEPNRALVFHFPSRRFAVLEGLGVELVATAYQPTVAPDLETMVQTPIDSLSGSPDDSGAPTQERLAGYKSATHELGLFAGASLEMILETGDLAHIDGRHAYVDAVRPMVDTDENHAARVTVGTRATRQQPVVFGGEEAQNVEGECHFRSDSRYHTYRTRVPAGAIEPRAMGFEVDFLDDGSAR